MRLYAENLEPHLGARINRGRARLVLSFDTAELCRANADRVELAPINTRSTLRKPARRGHGTFTPLGAHSYADWRRLRGKLDTIKEVTLKGGVTDVKACLVGAELRQPRS